MQLNVRLLLLKKAVFADNFQDYHKAFYQKLAYRE
jgi:hypothetical protein